MYGITMYCMLPLVLYSRKKPHKILPAFIFEAAKVLYPGYYTNVLLSFSTT